MSQTSQRRAANMQRAGSIDLGQLSWDDLRIFIVAARHESFRSAVRALRMNATTIARRIERLEKQFGYRLFDRIPEGIKLTREGRWVFSSAQTMEQASLSLRRYLDQDMTTRGVIRCSVTEGLGIYWIVPRLVEFHRANPYSVIDLNCTMNFSDIVRMESDVAIQLVRPTQNDLKVVKLGSMHVCLFAAQKYIDIFGMPQSLDELKQHRLIDQVSPQLPEGVLAHVLGLEDIEGQVAVRTNSSSAHFYAIELGVGIGLLPSYAVPLGANVVPLDLGIHRLLDIWLVYNPGIKDVPRIALFIDWLKSIFDPVAFPWFREQFVTPRELAAWRPKVSSPFEPAKGIVAHPISMQTEDHRTAAK